MNQIPDPIHPLIRARWSPYGFSARPVEPHDLAALFDAARHAPSAFNAQPWRYIAALRGEPCFDRILGCLVPTNQAWARHAGALALGAVQEEYPHNGKPNAAALHDLGSASAHLCFEATSRGISVHQMVGLDAARAQQEFAVPAGFRVFTAVAIGYAGDPGDVPAEVLARDAARRPRHPTAGFVFGEDWGKPASFVPGPVHP
jgi:nitroreductase